MTSADDAVKAAAEKVLKMTTLRWEGLGFRSALLAPKDLRALRLGIRDELAAAEQRGRLAEVQAMPCDGPALVDMQPVAHEEHCHRCRREAELQQQERPR